MRDFKAEYGKWLASPAIDDATRAELEALRCNEREIEDRFYRDLEFGTAGLRGVLGAGTNRMNVYVVRRTTQGLADYILASGGNAAERGVAIAYDSRRMSAEFALETALVLCANGIKTYLYESLRTVPQLSFAIGFLGCFAGVVITASHNPPQYNGYKVYADYGGQLPPEPSAEVTAYIERHEMFDVRRISEKEAIERGLLQYIGKEVDEEYYRRVKALSLNPEVLPAARFSAVYTPLHGAAAPAVKRVLNEAGFKNLHVVAEQEKPDGDFPTLRVPNPEEHDAFNLALPLAKKKGATLVFATDPDGDRMGAAAFDGSEYRFLTGNQIGCLLLHYILSERKKAGTLSDCFTVKSIVTTRMADKIAESFGVRIFSVYTGFRFIAEKIVESEASGQGKFVFGFEESYGFLAEPFVRDKDAISAALLLCEAAAYYDGMGMTVFDALQKLFETYGYYIEDVISYKLEGKEGQAKIAEAMEGLRANPPKDLGGVKIEAMRDYLLNVRIDANGKTSELSCEPSNVLYYEIEGDCWAAVRPSGTEPKLKAYIGSCGKSGRESQIKLQLLKDSVKEILDAKLAN